MRDNLSTKNISNCEKMHSSGKCLTNILIKFEQKHSNPIQSQCFLRATSGVLEFELSSLRTRHSGCPAWN